MAIYHFRAQVLTRGAGRSAIAAAAYRHRTKMMDEQIGTSWHYNRTEDLVHEEISLPSDAPAWAREMFEDRSVAQGSEAFWNAVEAHEKRSDAQLAREIVFALPQELTRDENIALARDFVETAFIQRGMVADWVFHDKEGNPHIHVMTTLRPLTEQGFGAKKVAELDERGEPVRQNGKIKYRLWAGDTERLNEWRAEWAQVANRHLALAGHQVQIDHRSYKDQGIQLEATAHLGPAANAVRQKLGALDKSHHVGAVRERNAEALRRDPASILQVVTSEKSVFTEQDIAKAILRYVDNVEAFDRIRYLVMSSSELVTLVPEIRDPETGQAVNKPLYSSREMVEAERRMAVDATLLAFTPSHGVHGAFVEKAIARKPYLADEQKEAIRHITGESRIAAVVGFAGAGKSTMLGAAREAWEAEGYRVFGAALAGKAAEELEKSSGIKGRTLASWELAWSKGQDLLKKGDVLVIDEAGMVSSKQLGRVLQHVKERGAKAVLVGDAMQLQPIEAGAAFRAITERIGYVELEGIRRQKDEWARTASVDFARGRTDKALEAYQARGAVAFEQTRDEAKAAIVRDWMASRGSGSTLILAHTNKDIFELNQAVRYGLIASGELGQGHQFKTERGARDFSAGDRIIFLKNDRELGVKNGMLGTVAKASHGALSVELDGGRRVEVNQIAYSNIDHGYAATIHKSQGSTVDRTFVLATPGMDQHLTYVGMSRHRESAVLYASREDFGTYKRLADRLGRSGAKETSLDYGEREAFAERRGFETARTIAPTFSAFVERQKAWISEQTARVQETWSRFQSAWSRVSSRAVEQARERVPAPQRSEALPRVEAAQRAPLFASITEFPRSVHEEATDRLRASPAYQDRYGELQATAAKMYKDPAVASERIETTFLKSQDAARVASVLMAAPEKAGELRGSDRLMDGLKARQERQEALANITALGVAIQQLGSTFELGMKRATEEEIQRRQRMSVEVPDLSPGARTALQEIERERQRGAEPYRVALSNLAAKPELSGEISRVAESLNRRFGPDGLTDRTRDPGRLVGSGERVKLESNRAVLATAIRIHSEHQAQAGLRLGRAQDSQIKR